MEYNIFMPRSLSRNSLGSIILSVLLAVGKIVADAQHPYRFIEQLGIAEGEFTFRKNHIYQAVHRLRGQEYVRSRQVKRGFLVITPTAKGKQMAKHISLMKMRLPKLDKWDGIWRVIIFDVPKDKDRNRLAFSDHLKRLGMRFLQKSVWVYPYECKKEITQMREYYDLASHVTYIEARHIESDDTLRQYFKI